MTKKRDKKNYFIHENATVLGDVILSKGCSVWPSAVIRGDLNQIILGRYVNIQDNCTLHADSNGKLEIGDYTLVGHRAMLHGCKIGKGCLIGIGCIILDGAEIGDGATITAGCMIRGGKKIPPKALVVQKGNELKIIEGRGKPLYSIAGCLEYYKLAKRLQKKKFKPFTPEQERGFLEKAKKIAARMKLLD